MIARTTNTVYSAFGPQDLSTVTEEIIDAFVQFHLRPRMIIRNIVSSRSYRVNMDTEIRGICHHDIHQML